MYCYHTHTQYCDGLTHPEEYVKEALRLGFHSLGFSGHAPVPFENQFAIPREKLTDYSSDILYLKEKYANYLNIYLGLEIDGIPGIMPSFKYFSELIGLDYTIGSVHLVYNPDNDKLWFIDGAHRETWDKGLQKIMQGDIKKGVTLYYQQIQQMVKQEKPDIVGHLDKICMHNANRFFTSNDKWYQDLVFETLEIVRAYECIIEVNTRGIYKGRSTQLYPEANLLPVIKKMSIPVVISADAHAPAELGLLFGETQELLESLGFRKTQIGIFECFV